MLLRLMTYNILDGGKGRESQILQVLQTAQPDILVLQEAIYLDLVHNLANALDMNLFFPSSNGKRRVALLSCLPILAPQSHQSFPPIWHNIVEAQIEFLPGHTLRLFGVHPVANLGIIFECWRRMEAKQVIKHYIPHRAELCIMTGDFNAIAPGDDIITRSMPKLLRFVIRTQGNRVYHFSIREYLAAGFIDCFRILHPHDNGFTLPAQRPNARLDYVFANEKMKPHLRSCRAITEPAAVLSASDHLPIIAEFEF